MELKQVVVNNGGMSQDMSISKQDDKFAFENKNIRIQATDDGTMLSVTNLRNSTPTETFGIKCDYVLGSCVTPEYLVIFCIYSDTDALKLFKTTWDCIYRIDLNSVDFTNSCKVLYKENKKNGTLNFDTSSYFDTLYYEEGETVKKVYWTDGKNNPRVINLITPSERNGGDFVSYGTNVFEFYPDIYKKSWLSPIGSKDRAAVLIPKIEVTKNRTVASELPAGVVQYFMSYYTVNGAETLIAASSDLYTIDYSNRGAKEDESGMCAFDIEIPSSKVNKNFDYIRIYSAIRTTNNGPLIVKIVGDIKIVKTGSTPTLYKLTDNGINQETLQDGYINFIGGTPFIAKTLTEKDGTAFFGNIKTESILLSDTLKNIITDSCFDVDGRSSKVITFSLTKEIPLNANQFGNKYPYSLQLDKGSKSYKTFKSGECYRFGIQFQTLQGQWSDVAWIGDVECTARPIFDSESQAFKVNDVNFVMPTAVRQYANAEGYVAYRILYADPENSNGRRIKAQGILCPTMFTPGQRAQNSPYSLPSWVMRPKNPKENGVAYHHFEPIFSSVVPGGEIASYTPSEIENDNIRYTVPYYEEKVDSRTSNCYIVTYVVVGNQNKLLVRSVKIWADEDTVKNNFYAPDGKEPSPDTYEVLCDYCVPYGGGSNEFNNALEAIAKSGYHNNPYGYCSKDGSGKLIYIQKEATAASPGTDGVIGWKKALSGVDLPEDWTLSPDLMQDIDHYLDYGTAPLSYCSNAFLKYINNLHTEQAYCIGEHLNLRENAETFNGKLETIIKKGFFPVFGRTTLSTDNFDSSGNEHSGSEYDDGNATDYIKRYEDGIFSTEKKEYTMSVDIPAQDYNMYECNFVTIPEIFRPRCTVNVVEEGPQYDSGWGTEDGNLYTHSTNNYGTPAPSDPYDYYQGLWGTWNYFEGFIQIMKVNDGVINNKIAKTYNDYYVDESIVTLNSPDIDSVPKNRETLNFNIVGVAPLNNCQVNYDSTVEHYASILGSINSSLLIEYNNAEFLPFYSDLIYNDIGWANNKLSNSVPATYNTYLFGANNFLGVTATSELEDLVLEYSGLPGIVKKQQIFNEYFSNNSLYLDSPLSYGSVYYGKTDDTGEPVVFRTNRGNGIYRPAYTNLVVSENTSHIYKSTSSKVNKLTLGNTMVKFSTTPHVVINLQNMEFGNRKYLLPHFKDDTNYYRTVADAKKYVWSREVPNISLENIPDDNPRGEWSQNENQDIDTISIKSIWKEDDTNVLETSEDYFLPAPYVLVSQDARSEESAIVSNALEYVINDSQKLQDILSSNYDLVNGTYTIRNSNSAKIVPAIYQHVVRTPVAPPSQDIKEVFLTTKKGYIDQFDVEITNSTVTAVSNVHIEYETSPVAGVGEQEVDTSTIYLDEDLRLYFKWYNEVKVYEGREITIGYLPYIEKVVADFPIKYVSEELNSESLTSEPYLYLGELYTDIDNDSLYGGTDITALRKLSWIPSSNAASLDIGTQDAPLTNMEGDTYYQRWDCLKTFPTTEEDVNQIVDITSFMVETHKNLDGRSDINRASYSLMSRSHNFNLFNDVYSQKNNIFEYTTRWTELNTEHIPNQIVWSMTKNYFGDVDTWANVNTSSSTRVTYPVTKLLNYNNTVMALTEHSLEVVNFNAKQLVPATDNSFIELQNSSKVDGTTKLQAPYGSHNMSTLITEKGLYFIEDNEKSLIRLGGEAGITKIGTTSMMDWLKNHIVQGTYGEGGSKKPFRLEYDIVHKDIYIVNDECCLVYNETLDAFISFITYSGSYWLYNYNGKLFAYRIGSDRKHLHIYEMYVGDSYNEDFQEYDYSNNGWLDYVPMEYSVWYRINPGPYSDKVFTNGTLMADVGVTGTNTTYPNSTKTSDKPFNTLRVWTEYQDTGDVELEHILDRPSLLKQKFRYWRFTIPRDANSAFKRDRIRNPWIHLQLKGNSTKKMEFHNLTVQYME